MFDLVRIMTTKIVLVLTFFTRFLISLELSITFDQENRSCWKQFYSRSAGVFPDSCGPSEDKEGITCYPKCQAGYNGSGPICWESCPNGFTVNFICFFKVEF